MLYLSQTWIKLSTIFTFTVNGIFRPNVDQIDHNFFSVKAVVVASLATKAWSFYVMPKNVMNQQFSTIFIFTGDAISQPNVDQINHNFFKWKAQSARLKRLKHFVVFVENQSHNGNNSLTWSSKRQTFSGSQIGTIRALINGDLSIFLKRENNPLL